MIENGYIRSMLVAFLQGAELDSGGEECYVDAVIQHQFVSTSELSLATFRSQYDSMILETNGIFLEFLQIDGDEIKGNFKSLIIKHFIAICLGLSV